MVAITHTYGCGVAIDAPGAAIPIQTLRHISTHANLGGTPLVVSLGCEKLQPARLFPERALRTLPVLDSDPYVVRMQDERGFGEDRQRDHARRREAPGATEPAAAAAVPASDWWSACSAAAATPSRA